jgi:uroporphyrinogen-III decarboxylase
LRIIGNLDKFALEKGRAPISAELDRLMPLMREGGFIPLPDHGIPPGVPLADYRWYLDRLRAMRF